jgi:hypothetical protein
MLYLFRGDAHEGDVHSCFRCAATTASYSINMKTIDHAFLQRVDGVVMGTVLWMYNCVLLTLGYWDKKDYVRNYGLRVDRGKNR